MSIFRDPSDKKKRKRLLKPSYKSTWTVEKVLQLLVNECNANIQMHEHWCFYAEEISAKYRIKIEIVQQAIQKFRLNIPQGYHIFTYNSAPHESSRNRFFWHGPNKGGWEATVYHVNKVIETIED
jgi:hypothetical protein